ncbi:hypothetical protein DIPPA_26228 [Diplonema papillatum]|nr:hypothetical protein DIPPA_26228 [Diplonema papillatum]
MDPGDHEGFTVGCTVRALKNITFKSGRRVDVGDTGTVTKVPGCQPGSPCQVKISNTAFSAVPGDFAPAHGTSDTRLDLEEASVQLW